MPEVFLQATVDRFEGAAAVLRLPDGQELVVASNLLPLGTSEGAQVAVRFGTTAEAQSERMQQARQLLTEILQGG